MANLNTKTISDGVGDILAVDGGIDASTPRQIKSGDGDVSPFYITTTKVGIGSATPYSPLHVVGAGQGAVSDGSSNIPTVLIEGTVTPLWLTTTKVGIGTDSPGAILEVADSIPVLRITGTRNDTWTVDQIMGSLEFFSEDASGNAGDTVRASISLVNDVGVEGSTTGLAFATKADVAGAPPERVRIDNSGKVGIGTTTPDRWLDVEGTTSTGRFYTKSSTATTDIVSFISDVGGAATQVWRVECDGDTLSATGSFISSDERVKENIITIPSALSKVNALRGTTFKWKYAGTEDTSYGLIAQEVEKIIPELVRDDGLIAPQGLKDTGVEEIKALNYTGLIPILIEAVKELSAKVEALENA